MKLKYPKSIFIGSTEFKIVLDKHYRGGNFDWETKILRIGTKPDTSQIFNILTHEIMEMWAIALYLRYDRPDNEKEYEFHFDHQHFTNLCEMASQTLSKFIK